MTHIFIVFAMGKKHPEFKTFEEALEWIRQSGDCPNPEILTNAKGKWQKAVALEFVNLDKRIAKIEENISWIKWLVVSIFGMTALAFAVQFIMKFFGF